jgi:hypothetical protein
MIDEPLLRAFIFSPGAPVGLFLWVESRAGQLHLGLVLAAIPA